MIKKDSSYWYGTIRGLIFGVTCGLGLAGLITKCASADFIFPLGICAILLTLVAWLIDEFFIGAATPAPEPDLADR